MSILGSIMNMVQGAGTNGQVAGGLVQQMQEQPGGLGSILSGFHQNGMGGLVQQWGQGNTQPADPNQVQQGLGTEAINSIAQRTGLSPEMVKVGAAVALPILIHHMTQNGHIDPQGQATGVAPEGGSILSSILSRL